MKNLGVKRALIVYGDDGLDESQSHPQQVSVRLMEMRSKNI